MLMEAMLLVQLKWQGEELMQVDESLLKEVREKNTQLYHHNVMITQQEQRVIVCYISDT